MNPVQKAISNVKHKIPMEILVETFITPEFGRNTLVPVTIDSQIREKVIDDRVAEDVNLVGGTQVVIPLTNITPEYLDTGVVVYRIPKTLTEGRRISRVVHLALLGGGGGIGIGAGLGGTVSCAASELTTDTRQVINALSPVPMVSSAAVRLIGENTIMVHFANGLMMNVGLRCYVEHETDFAELPSTSYPAFSKLVELATKAYIYNRLNIRLGQAALQGGFELGKIRDVVEGYSDADELYETYLEEVWRKVAILSDANSHRRHVMRLIGGAR